MFDAKLQKDLTDYYLEKKLSFKKEDIAYIAGKDTFKGKMLGFLTTDYYRREKLIRGGQLIYGYVYRTWTNEVTYTRPYPMWILFSPAQEFIDNPDLYSLVLTALQAIELPKRGQSELRKLHTMLNAELSEPKYVLIPEPYAQGHLVYLSMTYHRPWHNNNLKLGINPFIIGLSISKEILYLPTKYWNESFKKTYFDF
ncbi:MAG: hypothetical protein WCR77_03155 [Bacilli bacterium]|jgi:hypothetical protein|nr:hypothetical protein [Bacilli bacterium]